MQPKYSRLQPLSRFETPGPPNQQQVVYYTHFLRTLRSYKPCSTPATPPTLRGLEPAAHWVESTKPVKKSPTLDGPLSTITEGSLIEIVDIEAYVNRSTEERRREVATGKVPGKIKRPMNAFMLYRKAYQNRARVWCGQQYHRVISQVCGGSWPLEPDHARAQFTSWANIERDNHHKAHPGYKFTPSQAQKLRVATGMGTKRGRYDDERNLLSGSRSRNAKRKRGNHTRYDLTEIHPPEAMYDNDAPHGLPNQNRSAFQVSNPGKLLPEPYERIGELCGHYHQIVQLFQGPYGWVEDVRYRKILSPGHQGPWESSQSFRIHV